MREHSRKCGTTSGNSLRRGLSQIISWYGLAFPDVVVHIRKLISWRRLAFPDVSTTNFLMSPRISWCRLAFPDVGTNNFLMWARISWCALAFPDVGSHFLMSVQIISWCGLAFPDVLSHFLMWARISWCLGAHQEIICTDIRKCESTSGNYLAKTFQGISWDRGAFPDVSTNNFLMCSRISWCQYK
jgi:hypothetical protein